MKDVGIVGMPYSGKSTLFTAITGSHVGVGGSHQAVVEVPDERLETLARIESAAKTVPARIRFVDVPGGLTARAVGEFREMDALCLVVRAFGSDADPKSELAKLEVELLLADVASLESGLERARKRARSAAEARGEVEILEAAHALLDAQRPVRDGELDDRAVGLLKGYGLLTLKPWVVVENLDEGSAGQSPDLAADVVICAELEAEVAGMDEAEASELLAAYSIDEPAHSRVIAACYRALDLITFFTTVHDETHAWQVRRGAKAPEAAGVIHSDMERGFIRAEAMGYDELVDAGSWDAAKAKGLVRIEGKEYTVTEGDVLHVRFAV